MTVHFAFVAGVTAAVVTPGAPPGQLRRAPAARGGSVRQTAAVVRKRLRVSLCMAVSPVSGRGKSRRATEAHLFGDLDSSLGQALMTSILKDEGFAAAPGRF